MVISPNLIFNAIAYLLCGFYALLLLIIFFSLIIRRKPAMKGRRSSLTMVVPFKNERQDLIKCLNYYLEKKVLTFCDQIVFVNDHSRDISADELDVIFQNFPFTLIHLNTTNSGKKAAIHQAVEMASTEWIFTADIDSRPQFKQFDGILDAVNLSVGCVVVPIGPFKSEAAARKFFDLEFIVLQAVGCGMAGMHIPLLANGAALLFRKEYYLQSAKTRKDWNIPGGDDIFTMLAISSVYGRKAVYSVIPKKPPAEVDFPVGFEALWNQRLRWIHKVPDVKNHWFTLIAWLALGVNLIFIASWIAGIVQGAIEFPIVISLVKWIPELLLLTWGVLYFRRMDLIWFFLPALLLYPVYLLILAGTAQFHNPVWKK